MSAQEDLKEFLFWLFEYTENPVEIRSLGPEENDRKSIFTRTLDEVLIHTSRRVGWNHYYGVATRTPGKHRGTLEEVTELPAVWVDIDTYKLKIGWDEAVRKLESCLCPPSCIIMTGGGIHALWKFKEAVDISGGRGHEDLSAINRQLAGVFAGDTNVCDMARILRLPGFANQKYLDKPVCCIHRINSNQYDPSDLEDWLARQPPLLEGEKQARKATAAPENPFTVYAAAAGFKAPIDITARLDAMRLRGNGDASIHQTQLAVSGSMVAHGMDDDDIVTAILETTRRAAGYEGENWNWRREEKGIREMIAGARKKGYDQPRSRQDARPAPVALVQRDATTGGASPVVDLAAEKEKRKPKPAKEPTEQQIYKLADQVVQWWRDKHGEIKAIGGVLWTYRDGYWSRRTDRDDDYFRRGVHGIIRAAGFDGKSSFVTSVYGAAIGGPEIQADEPAWNSSGLLILRNGALDPMTGEMSPHSPDHWATSRVEADWRPGTAAPAWQQFWRDALRDVAGRDGIRATLMECMGAGLVKNLPREMRKGLFITGPSRCGKSVVAQVYRAMFSRVASPKVRQLGEKFGLQGLTSAQAWICDDAIGEREEMDAEFYKVIVTGEPVSISQKNKPDMEISFDIPVLLTANHLPKVKDNSEAVYNRTLVCPLVNVFSEASAALYVQQHGIEIAEHIIRDELSAVLEELVYGYRRLRMRCRFDPPEEMLAAVQEFQDENNPVGAWAREGMTLNAHVMVDNRDILGAVNGWRHLNYGEGKEFAGRMIIPALKRLFPSLREHKSVGWRYIVGLALTEEGQRHLEHWKAQTKDYGWLGGINDSPNKSAPAASTVSMKMDRKDDPFEPSASPPPPSGSRAPRF